MDAQAAARAVQTGRHSPRIGVILGSGLGGLSESIEDATATSFIDVPGMPRATVAGHAGEFVVGRLADQCVAVLRGRVHMYEGHSAATVAFPVRVLRALGCDTLIVTNAAGGLNPAFRTGDLMVIDDHVFFPGFAGAGPLVGEPGERFVSMTGAYDRSLSQLAVQKGEQLDIRVHRGVYAMVGGPHFETTAELRLLRLAGVDAVGMSTAPEVIVARQLAMRVLGISCITNEADPDRPVPVDHKEVLATGQAVGPSFAALIGAVLADL